MKTLYALVLLTFLGLVILGCSESTDQLVAPVEKASTISLEKGVLHFLATGSGHWKVIGWDDFVFESNVGSSFSAIMKSNG